MLLVNARKGPSHIHGMGLIAREFIPKGTVVWRFEPGFDIEVPETDMARLSPVAREQLLYYAYFDAGREAYVLSSDDDRFTNHSEAANTASEDRLAVASRDIAPGEEITGDYRELNVRFFGEHAGLEPERQGASGRRLRFKPLELADKAAIEAFAGAFAPYGDFCFSTAWFYDARRRTRWCWLNGCLAFEFCDSFGEGTFLTFLGRECADAAASALIGHAAESGHTATLWRVPEEAAAGLAGSGEAFEVGEDRDGFDYVYSVEGLASLSGPGYSRLRKKVGHFSRACPGRCVAAVDLSDPGAREDALRLMSRWVDGKQSQSTIQDYCAAFGRCLRDWRSFELSALAVLVGGSLAGVMVVERARKEWLVGHFCFADPSIPDLSAFLLHKVGEWGSRLGFRHLNYQEDLGDPGLRRFKSERAPSSFLRKFSVRLRREPGGTQSEGEIEDGRAVSA